MRTPARYRAETKYTETTEKKANTNLPIMARVGDGGGVGAVVGRDNFYWVRMYNDPNRVTQCYSILPVANNDWIYMAKARDRNLTYYEFVAFIQLAGGGTGPPVQVHDHSSIAQGGTHWGGITQTYGGGSGANIVTIPTALAIGLTLVDTAPVEYLRIRTAAQLAVVWNNGEADVDFRVAASAGGGPAGGTNALFVEGLTGSVIVGDATAVGAEMFCIVSENPVTQGNYRYAADTGGGSFRMGKARGTRAVPGIVVAGDQLGAFYGLGWDGAAFIEAAVIHFRASPAPLGPGVNDMPGEIRFGTTADGAAAPTDAVIITQNNKMGIGTMTVPHGGVGYAMLALDGSNTSAAGPHVQFTTDTNDYPLLQMFMWGHDNIGLSFDSYYDGAWKSSDPGSSFMIYKTSDLFQIRYDVAAAGGAIAWNTGLIMDVNGHVYPGSVKAQDLGLETAEWRTVHCNAVDTTCGRLVRATRACPICSTEMVRGAGTLFVGGEESDFALAHCPNCGNAAMEEIKHLSPEKLSEKRPVPKVILEDVQVHVGGSRHHISVYFRYGEDVVDGKGNIIKQAIRNATRLGEYEINEFLAASDKDRLAFLLALGQREWDSREETRLAQEEAADLRLVTEPKVKLWLGKDLLTLPN